MPKKNVKKYKVYFDFMFHPDINRVLFFNFLSFKYNVFFHKQTLFYRYKTFKLRYKNKNK